MAPRILMTFDRAVQLWLLRATPEDDLWDHAVVDRWFEVDDT